MAQVNIKKTAVFNIPPENTRAYSFDFFGNAGIVNEQGVFVPLNFDTQIRNIIATLGIGLEVDLPANPNIGDIYITSDSFKKYTSSDSISWVVEDLENGQFITDSINVILYQYNENALTLLCKAVHDHSDDSNSGNIPIASITGLVDELLWEKTPDISEILYGRLYNWYAVNTGKLAPIGWRVPTDAEWTTLSTYLGGDSVAGGKLKEVGIEHWLDPNTGATDEFGYTAIPSGSRLSDAIFYNIGAFSTCWSIMESSTEAAYYCYLDYNNSFMLLSGDFKASGLSVRCIYDGVGAPTEPIIYDADGNSYNWVQIGTQYWLGKNLATTTYNDGTAIPNVTNNAEWATLTTGAYCSYNNDEGFVFEITVDEIHIQPKDSKRIKSEIIDGLGPASSTANTVPVYADETGKVFEQSSVEINGDNMKPQLVTFKTPTELTGTNAMDFNINQNWIVYLSGATTTITMTPITASAVFTCNIEVVQDATGGRDLVLVDVDGKAIVNTQEFDFTSGGANERCFITIKYWVTGYRYLVDKYV